MEGKFQRRKIKMNKKTAVLSTAVILSLALGGVAYAHWMEIITVDGFVQTGSLELAPSIIDYGLWQNKPIAEWNIISNCGYDLEFELINIYPCLEAYICMKVENIGTIPAGLQEIRLEFLEFSTDDGATWNDFVEGVDYVSTDWSYYEPVSGPPQYTKWIYPVGVPQTMMNAIARIRVDVSAPVPNYPGAPPHSWAQIDPGMSVDACAYMHFYEGLPESTQFRFQVQLEYWNWNEVV